MTRLRTYPAPSRSRRVKPVTRPFDDDESDETILGLGFSETKDAPGAGMTPESSTGD